MPDETVEQKRQRYLALSHAMQTGVAHEMNFPERGDPTTPKHLRVGVNMAMVEHGALVQLLIARGLFTEAEYYDALNAAMEREVALYESRLSEMMGATIHLV